MIDRALIRSVEGFSLKGYVPDPQGSKSGVSVATAFDAGQRSEADLMDLPNTLRVKLHPYLHLRGPKAVEALRARPLEITAEEADLLDAKTFAETLRLLRAILPGFDTLPDAIQTVAFSVAFQYGDLREECPRFYAFLAGRDWKGVYEALRDFCDDHPTRRWNEAAYLKEHLK